MSDAPQDQLDEGQGCLLQRGLVALSIELQAQEPLRTAGLELA